jgi:glycosyltransferase involved in cell wall biosynthesis
LSHRRSDACETAPRQGCGECLQATFPHWLRSDDREAKVRAVHERALAALSLPQRLVVPSARAIPPFVALGVAADRFHVVENGVDTERLLTLPPPAAGPGPLRLGYFGTLIPSKGLHVLIDAVQALPSGTVELRIHGNAASYHGDDSYLVRCFQRLRPGSGITYHGPYGLDDLPRLLSSIDVLAAPALWREAFGLTVREALAAGRPVLLSRIGGLQDAIADGAEGRVLPPGAPAAWAAAIQQVASDRSLVARWSAATRRRARGFVDMSTDLLAVYAEARATSGLPAA